MSCKSRLTMLDKVDVRANDNFPPVVGKLQMDLMLLAHICGLTNVSTLMSSPTPTAGNTIPGSA